MNFSQTILLKWLKNVRKADHELVAIQHMLHSTPDIILGNADFALNGISGHNMQVYERSLNLFGKALLNYIGNINLEQ